MRGNKSPKSADMREQSTFGVATFHCVSAPAIAILQYFIVTSLMLQDSNIQAILEDLMKGTEQLLFSFIVPSTFCSTDNIVELQKLVTQGGFEISLHFFLDLLQAAINSRESFSLLTAWPSCHTRLAP